MMSNSYRKWERLNNQYRDKKTSLPQALPDPTPFIIFRTINISHVGPDSLTYGLTVELLEPVSKDQLYEKIDQFHKIIRFMPNLLNTFSDKSVGFYIEFKERQHYGKVQELIKGIVKELLEVA